MEVERQNLVEVRERKERVSVKFKFWEVEM